MTKKLCQEEVNELRSQVLRLQKELRTMQKELTEYKEHSILWSVEDFISRAKETRWKISKEQAKRALDDMIHHHDAEYGIGWPTLDYYIDQYGEPYKSRKRASEKRGKVFLEFVKKNMPVGNPEDSADYHTGPEPPVMEVEETYVSDCCGAPGQKDSMFCGSCGNGARFINPNLPRRD